MSSSNSSSVVEFYSTVDRGVEIQERFTETFISALRVWNNFAKSLALALFVNPSLPVSVFDMACGRGGDFTKIMLLYPSTQAYTGVDITPKCIEDFQTRVKHATKPSIFDAFVQDLSLPIPHQFYDRYSTVNMGFAFHYFWKSDETIRAILSNISNILITNGRAIITTTDEEIIKDRLSKSMYTKNETRQELRVMSEHNHELVCRIVTDKRVDGYHFELIDKPGSYAVKAPEYFVNMALLRRHAGDYGLDVLHVEPLHAFAKRNTTHPLAEHMGILSNSLSIAEKTIMSMYQLIVLEKRSTIRLQGSEFLSAPATFESFNAFISEPSGPPPSWK